MHTAFMGQPFGSFCRSGADAGEGAGQPMVRIQTRYTQSTWLLDSALAYGEALLKSGGRRWELLSMSLTMASSHPSAQNLWLVASRSFADHSADS